MTLEQLWERVVAREGVTLDPAEVQALYADVERVVREQRQAARTQALEDAACIPEMIYFAPDYTLDMNRRVIARAIRALPSEEPEHELLAHQGDAKTPPAP